MITSLLMLSTLWRAHAFVTKSVLPATRVIDLVPSLITPGPQVDDQAIFARGNLATCAYVSGNAGEEALPSDSNTSYLILSFTQLLP